MLCTIIFVTINLWKQLQIFLAFLKISPNACWTDVLFYTEVYTEWVISTPYDMNFLHLQIEPVVCHQLLPCLGGFLTQNKNLTLAYTCTALFNLVFEKDVSTEKNRSALLVVFFSVCGLTLSQILSAFKWYFLSNVHPWLNQRVL